MEDFSSSESEASGYESGHSRFMNEASLSDWDEYDVSSEKETSREGQKGAKSRIPRKTKRMENNNSNKHLKALYDSGSAKGSHPSRRESADKVLSSGKNSKGSTLRNQLKAAILSDYKLGPLFGAENSSKDSKSASKPLPDPNKVNELDCLNNRHHSNPYPLGKTFISQLMKTQLKFSNSKRASRKKYKEKNSSSEQASTSKRKTKLFTSDNEDGVLKDVKSITHCLLENTLNKLNLKESSRLIMDHIDDPVIGTPPKNAEVSSSFQIFNTPVASTSVCFAENHDRNINVNAIKRMIINESGYANHESEIEATPTSLDTIMTSICPHRSNNSNVGTKTGNSGRDLNNNANGVSNRSDCSNSSEETVDISSHDNRSFKSIVGSSREALFDSNSQIDLLDEFDLPPLLSEIESVRTIRTPNVVLIGVNLLNDSDTATDVVFPDWLLQMLRTNFPSENDEVPEGPHFYCQGDGLGVHPSIITVTIDDEDVDVSSESSIINSRGGYSLVIDNSILDIASLPADSETTAEDENDRDENTNAQVVTVNYHRQSTYPTVAADESEEYFDTSDELSDDAV